jgi:DNA-binding CsgD family transcriptional regulator
MIVALNGAITPSTVTYLGARALRTFGINAPKVRAPPVILAVAAHAVEGVTVLTKANGQATEQDHSRQLHISIERFDRGLLPRAVPSAKIVRGGDLFGSQTLTAAEADVVGLRVQGLDIREIASSRVAATRTVANQCRSALAKLGVRTRAELLSKLIRAAK